MTVSSVADTSVHITFHGWLEYFLTARGCKQEDKVILSPSLSLLNFPHSLTQFLNSRFASFEFPEEFSKLKGCPFSLVANYALWYLSVRRLSLSYWTENPDDTVLWRGRCLMEKIGNTFFCLFVFTCQVKKTISLEIKPLNSLSNQNSKLITF